MFWKKKKSRLLEPGAQAPDFSLPDQDGRPVKLSDFRGRRVLLYFYPKADTRGCTAQSCGFRDRHATIGAGGVVLGVSFDTPAEQKAFRDKYALPFPLLCDTERKVSLAWGACADGQAKYPDRVTYVIAADGTVESAETVTDIAAHVDAAIARLNDI